VTLKERIAFTTDTSATDYRVAFADCATGRTVSVAWACRPQYREVQACMKLYLGEESMKERKRIYLQEKRNKTGV
jgi:COX assembly protein 1